MGARKDPRKEGEELKTLDFQLTNLNKGKGSQGLLHRVLLPIHSFLSARVGKRREDWSRYDYVIFVRARS